MGLKSVGRYGALLVITAVIAGAVKAQEMQVIRPGMSESDVVAVFGEPQGKSDYDNFVFYFYDNGCEKECGFPDTVFFEDGQVVDAVLRAPWRDYAGESSSPKGVMPRPNPGGERLEVPGTLESVEVRPAPPPPAKPDTTSRN
ncbi:MAG: hypothetical protein PVI01_01660 [Gemmatimonadales bacterium]|jgi:hypothetical protein